MSELRFDGRVVIVTGAGNGLGRAHARLFAGRGAKVIVNDLGGDRHGGGKGSEAADRVVAEIREAGGEAIANYDSVTEGERIVKAAVDAFGRVDVVVNNAGILRDKSFHNMTREDWDLIYQVHVLGAFAVTHAAWPIMREQQFGRVIMTVSAAGIYGNRGQANYAMAKLGLHGFGQALAVEGERNNIRVNSIAPIAGSRLTETVMPAKALEALSPEVVSPLVAWLCHADCEATGQLFELGAGFYSKLRWQRSRGVTYRVGRAVPPEVFRDRWDELTQFDEGAEFPSTIQQSMGPVMANVSAGPSKGGNEFIDVDRALGYEFPPVTTTYDARDVALYALGIGAATNALDDKQLRYVFERHGEGMVPLPTFAVVPALAAAMELAQKGQQAPGLHYGFDRVLHGEQKTELAYPMPKKAKLRHQSRVKEILDKGKGALVVTETSSYDEDGALVCRNETSTFVRGAGGFGGDRGSTDAVNVPPDRAPDAIVEEKTADNQALLYRLSGDWNPLHADPRFAQAMKFERPILHGLCTYGFAARHVLERFAPSGDARYFKSLAVRFSGVVFPGETLVTEMWREHDQRIVLQVKVKERDTVVISNAALELFEKIPEKPKKQVTAERARGAAAEPTTADVMRAIRDTITAHPDVAKKAGKVFQFALKEPDEVWTLDLPNGKVEPGETAKPDCTFHLRVADFIAMVRGEKDAMKLYMGGELKIKGDAMASQKLGAVLKKVDPASLTRAAAEPPTQTSAPAPKAEGRSASAEKLAAKLANEVGPAAAHGGVIQFRVTDPDFAFAVDWTSTPPTVKPGRRPDATTVITIDDESLEALAKDPTGARALYQRGKMQIEGDLEAARDLGFLALGNT